MLVAFTSIVYNLALAGSSTDAIVNVLILLFINDLDEKLLAMTEIIADEWTANQLKEVKEFMETFTNNKHPSSSLSTNITNMPRHAKSLGNNPPLATNQPNATPSYPTVKPVYSNTTAKLSGAATDAQVPATPSYPNVPALYVNTKVSKYIL